MHELLARGHNSVRSHVASARLERNHVPAEAGEGSITEGGFPCLAPRTVHLWLFDTDMLSERARLASIETVSDDERLRASSFRDRCHQDRFLIGRGMIRSVLGRYRAAAPRTLRFETGRYGKPRLSDCPFHINWSHAGSTWALAVAASGAVGVDIEADGRAHAWRGPMSVAYADQEQAFVLDQPESASDRFLAIWTLKEALFKATGQGLHDSMSSVSIVGPDLTIRPWLDLADGKRWHLQGLSLASPYRAAVAANFPIVHLEMFHEGNLGHLHEGQSLRCRPSCSPTGSPGGEKQ